MTIESDERSHHKEMEHAKVVGMKKVSDEYFDREMVELRGRINMVEKLLDEYEEDHW
jgi:hypothetical protein